MRVLDVSNLCVTIGNTQLIKNANFTIDEGDVVLLTGPNGCGKSTILKIFMGDLFDYRGIEYKADEAIFYIINQKYDFLNNKKDQELFRRQVCYISQDDYFETDSILDCFRNSLAFCSAIPDKNKYIFDFVRKFDLQDCFLIDDVDISFSVNRLIKILNLNKQELSSKDYRAIKLLSLSIRRLSGGQKKIANIITNLIRCEFSKLILIDEPLNNLDYKNVRTVSNILTKIHNANPNVGILIVTHCRSIPIINKVVEINSKDRTVYVSKEYVCNTCFGHLNDKGIYD